MGKRISAIITTASAVSMPARTILCRTAFRLFCIGLSSFCLRPRPGLTGTKKAVDTCISSTGNRHLLLSGLLPSVAEFHRILQLTLLADYHCRRGITPHPEDSIFIKFAYSIALRGPAVNCAQKSIFETILRAKEQLYSLPSRPLL